MVELGLLGLLGLAILHPCSTISNCFFSHFLNIRLDRWGAYSLCQRDARNSLSPVAGVAQVVDGLLVAYRS